MSYNTTNNNNEIDSDVQYSKVRFINSSNELDGIDIYINDQILITELQPQDITRYYSALPGVYEISIKPSGENSNIIYSEVFEAMEGITYTLSIIGTPTDIDVNLIIDNESPNATSRAGIKFINTSDFNTKIDISINKTNLVSALEYNDYTDYYSIKPDIYTLEIYENDSDNLLLSIPDVDLNSGENYSCHISNLSNENPNINFVICSDIQ